MSVRRRFSIRSQWQDPWYQGLKPWAKLVLEYIRDHCNHAGIWVVDFERADYEIGFERMGLKLNWATEVYQELVRPPANVRDAQIRYGYRPDILRLHQLPKKWWYAPYLEEQMGKGFQIGTGCRHLPIFRTLRVNGLIPTMLEYWPNSISPILLANPNYKWDVLTPPQMEAAKMAHIQQLKEAFAK